MHCISIFIHITQQGFSWTIEANLWDYFSLLQQCETSRERFGRKRRDRRKCQKPWRRCWIKAERRPNAKLQHLARRIRIRRIEVNARDTSCKRLIRANIAQYEIALRNVSKVNDQIGTFG